MHTHQHIPSHTKEDVKQIQEKETKCLLTTSLFPFSKNTCCPLGSPFILSSYIHITNNIQKWWTRECNKKTRLKYRHSPTEGHGQDALVVDAKGWLGHWQSYDVHLIQQYELFSKWSSHARELPSTNNFVCFLAFACPKYCPRSVAWCCFDHIHFHCSNKCILQDHDWWPSLHYHRSQRSLPPCMIVDQLNT